ncbi:MAG: hypothetical protein V4436_00085 [Patescibacteria group bacterium]
MDEDYYHTLVMAYYMNKLKNSKRKISVALDRIRFVAQRNTVDPAKRRSIRERCKLLATGLMRTVQTGENEE